MTIGGEDEDVMRQERTTIGTTKQIENDKTSKKIDTKKRGGEEIPR